MILWMRRLASPLVVWPERVPFLVGKHIGQPQARQNHHALGHPRDPSRERRDRWRGGGDAGGDGKARRRVALPPLRKPPEKSIAPLREVDPAALRQQLRPRLVNQPELRQRRFPMSR